MHRRSTWWATSMIGIRGLSSAGTRRRPLGHPRRGGNRRLRVSVFPRDRAGCPETQRSRRRGDDKLSHNELAIVLAECQRDPARCNHRGWHLLVDRMRSIQDMSPFSPPEALKKTYSANLRTPSSRERSRDSPWRTDRSPVVSSTTARIPSKLVTLASLSFATMSA